MGKVNLKSLWLLRELVLPCFHWTTWLWLWEWWSKVDEKCPEEMCTAWGCLQEPFHPIRRWADGSAVVLPWCIAHWQAFPVSFKRHREVSAKADRCHLKFYLFICFVRKAFALSFLLVFNFLYRHAGGSTAGQYQILLFDYTLAFLDPAFLHVGSL